MRSRPIASLVLPGALLLLAADDIPVLTGTLDERYAGAQEQDRYRVVRSGVSKNRVFRSGVSKVLPRYRTAQVSGRRIVGLSSGPFNGVADLTRVQILLPRIASPQRICFSATTRDGFYAAVGLLTAPANSRGAARPGFQSRLRQQLARSPMSDLAVRATIGTDCQSDPTPALLITSYGGAPSQLKVMVQSRGARSISATLTDSAGATSATSCASDPAKVSRAFDLECHLDTRRLRRVGAATLRLDIRNRSGSPSSEVASLLWAA